MRRRLPTRSTTVHGTSAEEDKHEARTADRTPGPPVRGGSGRPDAAESRAMRLSRACRLAAVSAGMLLGVTALTGCGVTRGDQSRDNLMIIPNSPGGGYDQTGRAAVEVMVDND